MLKLSILEFFFNINTRKSRIYSGYLFFYQKDFFTKKKTSNNGIIICYRSLFC